MTSMALHRMNRFWLSGLTDLLETAGATLRTWRERERGRSELAKLSPLELKDIGLSRPSARFEANKPFWRA